MSPVNDMKMEMPPVKKRKLKLTQANVLNLQDQQTWDLDSMVSIDKKPKVEYNIEMDADSIIKICK